MQILIIYLVKDWEFFLVSGKVAVTFHTPFILSDHTIKFVHHDLSQELVQKYQWYEKIFLYTNW